MNSKTSLSDRMLPVSESCVIPTGYLHNPSNVIQDTVFNHLPNRRNQTLKTAQTHTSKIIQDMKNHDNPPDGLPAIIREKDLVWRQKTMNQFLKINNFSSITEETKKKEIHAKIHKKAELAFVENISDYASANYQNKKNQGTMFVNELWGRKYHQSMVTVSGLKNAQYRIKGKFLKATTERMKELEKYYEEKHADEIKQQRSFIEAMIIPYENTEIDNDFRAMLNSKRDDSKSQTLKSRESQTQGQKS